MARQTNGTNQSLQSATLTLGGPSKLAMSMWLWWDVYGTASKQAAEYGPSWSSDAISDWIAVPDHTTGNFVAGCGQSGAISLREFTRPSAAAWHHYVFNFDISLASNDFVSSYVDGSLSTLTTIVNDNPTAAFGDKALNLMARNNTSLWGAGRIAEVAVWAGVNLTGTDAANLSAGTLPTAIQAGSLKHYWKLCGTNSPEPDSVGGADMTVNGATIVDHPPSVLGSCQTTITGLGRKFVLRPQ